MLRFLAMGVAAGWMWSGVAAAQEDGPKAPEAPTVEEVAEPAAEKVVVPAADEKVPAEAAAKPFKPGPEGIPYDPKCDWKILIRPDGYDAANEWAYTFNPYWEFAADCPAPPCGARMTYDEAYGLIPYRRAEFRANPLYRHEAALELMFGQLRPMTVVRTYGPALPTTRVNVSIGGYGWRPWYSLYAYPLY